MALGTLVGTRCHQDYVGSCQGDKSTDLDADNEVTPSYDAGNKITHSWESPNMIPMTDQYTSSRPTVNGFLHSGGCGWLLKPC